MSKEITKEHLDFLKERAGWDEEQASKFLNTAKPVQKKLILDASLLRGKLEELCKLAIIVSGQIEISFLLAVEDEPAFVGLVAEMTGEKGGKLTLATEKQLQGNKDLIN